MKLTCLEKEKKKKKRFLWTLDVEGRNLTCETSFYDVFFGFTIHLRGQCWTIDGFDAWSFVSYGFSNTPGLKSKKFFYCVLRVFFFFFFAKTVCLRVILRFSLTSHIFLVMYQELYQKWVSCCKSYRMLKYECFFILRVLLTSQVLIYGNLI